MSKLHEKLLDLIIQVDCLLRENNIKYGLQYGTLLGAVRHEGFIPWDDDVDISMTREEFNKLLKLVENEQTGELSFENNFWVPQLVSSTLKHNNIPISIDIFIIDKVPTNKKKSSIQVLKLKILQGMLKKTSIKSNRYSFLNKIQILVTRFMGIFFTNKFKIKKYNKISGKYSKTSKYVYKILNGEYGDFKIEFSKDSFTNMSYIKFENTKLPVYDNYDYILKKIYGDYLTPVKEGFTKHYK